MVKARKKYGFNPDYAVAPGDTLMEVLESLGMDQKELTAQTDLPPQFLGLIINGSQPIDPEIADKLERATGVPASLWNNLEAQYRILS